MAKQSWKQQMYEQIANSQVQQVMQQKQNEQIQASFDAWQKEQNEIAQIQTNFDAWLKDNPQPVQPIQTAPVQTVKKEEPKQESIPSIADFFKPTTASGRDLNKETAERLSEEEARRTKQRRTAINDTLNVLNSSEFKDAAKKGEAQKIVEEKEKAKKTIGGSINQLDLSKYNLPSESGITEQEQKSFDDYTKALEWADPNYRMTKEEQQEARRIASEGKQALAEKYPVENKADFGKLYERMSPEDQAKYRTFDDLALKSDPLAVASVGAADKAVSMLGGALNTVAFFHPEAIQAARGYKELQKKWNEAKEATATEEIAKSATPLAENVPVIGEITPYGVGQAATQIGAYALTNNAFDEMGAALLGDKLGKLGGFIGNQVGQNAQDIALDTIPRYQELKTQGKSDEEIRDTLIQEGLWNFGGNLGLGLLGEIPGLFKSASDTLSAKKAADEAFRENVLAGKDTLAKLANAEDVDNVVRSATRQAEEATQNIENIAKQMPEIPENVPVRPGTAAPVSPSIENAAEEISKAMDAEEAARAIEPPKTNKVDIPDETQEQILSDFEEIYRSMDNMDRAANATGNAKAIEKFKKLQKSVFDYEDKVWNAETLEEVNKAKKAADAARQSFIREMKKVDPNYTGDLTGTKLGQAIYRRGNPKLSDVDTQSMIDDWVKQDVENPNRFVKDAEPDNVNIYRGANNVPGAEPLQTFGNGATGQWKTSKARTNTFENQGWGDNLPEKDYAYRVQSTADTHDIKAERYKDSTNIADDLLNKDYDTFDAADVKASMETIQELMDNGNFRKARSLAERLAYEGREGGRTVQAFAEYNKNTAVGALQDAQKAQDDFVLDPWRSKNKKARQGNSRIAKALADMGHKADNKIKPELTHDQIKNGVIAELNREVGSVEKYFNDSDIDFLTQMAEDKSIPVWQITSEIEHKLNTGSWYTLDESVAIPKPTNRKLQNALDSLVEETIRTENATPSLKQITEEVRNTLGKESADFDGLFTDDDIEYLANLIHEGASKDELADALDMKLATGSFGISDETLQEVNNIFKQISNYDPNSKQFVEGQAEAYRLLADEILPNATLKEKFEAWRYIAMLGNPKTMLRNYIGNQTFNVVTGISNNIAAIAEAGIDRASKALGGEGIQRTKAVLNPKTDSGLIKACAEDADASRYRQIIGSKYEKMSKDTLRRSKSVFNSKLAQLYEKVTDAGISDYSAVKKKYSTSLAGYMKANGMTTDIFKAEDELRNLKSLGETRLLSDAEQARIATLSNQIQELEKARDYALKQAEYATFHEDNKIASVLSKWSKTSKEEGTGIGHILLEGMVPFKKTPANVLRSGVEYSPLGAIDSIKKTGKLIYENTGARKGNLADVYKNKAGKEVARTLASDVIDSWSKTLTGTGLTALGFYLYNKGVLHSSDPDTKYQDELEGHQNYAIEINGKSYTIDWAAPTVMPLMVGAEIAKLWDSTGKGDKNFYDNIDGYVEAANRIADPLIETSMLQGVRDTLETAATYAQNNEAMNILPLLAYNTATGYATQGIPTLGGQIARTVDPTRRSTYTDQEGVAGVLDRQLKKQMNKIPGVSTLNQPYVDTYGREQQNSPFNNPLANLGYQMFSPGYLSNINETDADLMSREAYEVGNVANTLPKWQSKFKDAEGNRVSPEDYTTAAKAYGQANYEIRDALANDDWFKSLEGTQKEEIVKGINTIAEHVGNAAIDPEYSKNSKPYNAYKEGGIPELLEYYKGETAKGTAKELLGDSGVTTNSNAGKAVVEAVKNGDMEQAEQLADQAKEEKAEKVKVEETKEDLSSYGLTGISPAKTYEKAQGVIPGLTTEKFATTYKKIDADGNQGIKQDEIIAYLNSQKITSESEAKKIWSAYGNTTWKSIPTLENGKWVKKKK